MRTIYLREGVQIGNDAVMGSRCFGTADVRINPQDALSLQPLTGGLDTWFCEPLDLLVRKKNDIAIFPFFLLVQDLGHMHGIMLGKHDDDPHFIEPGDPFLSPVVIPVISITFEGWMRS